MYLIHLIVGDVYVATLRSMNWNVATKVGSAGAFWIQGAAIVALTYGLAALSKRYLEDPFLRLKRRFV